MSTREELEKAVEDAGVAWRAAWNAVEVTRASYIGVTDGDAANNVMDTLEDTREIAEAEYGKAKYLLAQHDKENLK